MLTSYTVYMQVCHMGNMLEYVQTQIKSLDIGILLKNSLTSGMGV